MAANCLIDISFTITPETDSKIQSNLNYLLTMLLFNYVHLKNHYLPLA